MPSLNITVVVSTHNRASLLNKLLTSLNRAERPEQASLSILVIANACNDNTVATLENYRQRQEPELLIPLVFAEEPRPGKSFALNKALMMITEGWICFVDDDHRLDHLYFKSITDAINQFPDTTMFCGKIVPDWTGREPAWVHDRGEFKITPFPIPYFDLGNEPLNVSKNTAIPGGGNLIVAYDVFKRIGKFSEALGPKGHNLMGSEDSDFVLRALDANETIQYVPAIVQYHYVDPKHLKLGYLIKKSFQRNRSITLTRYPSRSHIPSYMWNKLIRYMAGALFSFDRDKTRYYLTRFSCVLGQIFGRLQSRAH